MVGDAASCGTANQISPNVRVLTGLRPPLRFWVLLGRWLRFSGGGYVFGFCWATLSPSFWFTCGSQSFPAISGSSKTTAAAHMSVV